MSRSLPNMERLHATETSSTLPYTVYNNVINNSNHNNNNTVIVIIFVTWMYDLVNSVIYGA